VVTPKKAICVRNCYDHFGLHARITTVTDIHERVEIVRRRRAFDLDPAAFCATWDKEQQKLGKRIRAAQKLLPVDIADDALYAAAELCALLAIDGHRGELTLIRAAGAFASLRKAHLGQANDAFGWQCWPCVTVCAKTRSRVAVTKCASSAPSPIFAPNARRRSILRMD
jgi:Mg-chelatase subunit ChlI